MQKIMETPSRATPGCGPIVRRRRPCGMGNKYRRDYHTKLVQKLLVVLQYTSWHASGDVDRKWVFYKK